MPDRSPFDEAFDGPLAEFGRRIVEYILDRVDRESTNVYLEVLRASGAEAVRLRLGEMTDASFSKLLTGSSGSDGALRTRLVAAYKRRAVCAPSRFTGRHRAPTTVGRSSPSTAQQYSRS